MRKDYYSILGLTEEEKKLKGNDFVEVLKKKYRKLCLEYHPDRQQGKSDEEKKKAEEMFKDIAEAYSVLSDEEKRAQYDNPASGFQFDGMHSDFVKEFMRRHMEDFGFNPFGGFERRPQANNRMAQVDMTLAELMKDTKKTVRYQRFVTCPDCNGSGAKSASDIVDCPICHGHGFVSQQTGMWTMQTQCGHCGGSGKIIKNPCKKCQGHGVCKSDETIEVTIPKGTIEGTKLSVRGMGDVINGHESGSLILVVHEKPDNKFVREGYDLFTSVKVPAIELFSGTKIAVTTVDGRNLSVTLPEGIDMSNDLRLNGQGMPKLNSGEVGDMYISIIPVFPKKLSKRQKELVESLKKELK